MREIRTQIKECELRKAKLVERFKSLPELKYLLH